MLFQVARNTERFLAPIKRALKRSQASVNPAVSLEVGQVSEPSVTNGTLVRSLARVGPDVCLEVVRFVE